MALSEVIRVRVSAEELYKLSEQAAARNISISELIREKISGAVVQTSPVVQKTPVSKKSFVSRLKGEWKP